MLAHVGGDGSAFAVLFQRWAPRLSAMFRRSGVPRDDVRDLLQQTFFQLHRARHDFREGTRLRPWIYTIALNLQRQYFRRRARKPEAPLDGDAASATPTAGSNALVEARELRDALARLPDAQREVIVLHWFEGLTFREVGDVVGATQTAVKVRAHRGYAKLRALLEAAGIGAPVTRAPPADYEGQESS